MTMVTSMQAAVLDGAGTAFRMASIPRPRPQPGQVLVRINASAVNPLGEAYRALESSDTAGKIVVDIGG
jgi:NADPH2:quinone reductase